MIEKSSQRRDKVKERSPTNSPVAFSGTNFRLEQLKWVSTVTSFESAELQLKIISRHVKDFGFKFRTARHDIYHLECPKQSSSGLSSP